MGASDGKGKGKAKWRERRRDPTGVYGEITWGSFLRFYGRSDAEKLWDEAGGPVSGEAEAQHQQQDHARLALQHAAF